MKKRLAAAAMALAALLVFCGCGAPGRTYNETSSSNTMPSDMGFDQMQDISSEDMAPQGVGMAEVKADTRRKLIKNYSADIQTLEFEAALAEIERMTAESGGYIESSSQSGSGAVDYGRVYPRSASYTLRIPVGKAEDVMAALEQVGAVTNISRSSDDVTDYYYDTEAHLRSLRTQETRLLELLEKADSVDTMMTIESSLSDVRYQIESLDGTMRRLDDQIEYSTVELYIDEVFSPDEIERSPVTLGERIAGRFKASLKNIRNGAEDLIVFLIGDSLLIIFWAAVIAGLVIIYKKVKPKLCRKAEKQKSDEK